MRVAAKQDLQDLGQDSQPKSQTLSELFLKAPHGSAITIPNKVVAHEFAINEIISELPTTFFWKFSRLKVDAITGNWLPGHVGTTVAPKKHTVFHLRGVRNCLVFCQMSWTELNWAGLWHLETDICTFSQEQALCSWRFPLFSPFFFWLWLHFSLSFLDIHILALMIFSLLSYALHVRRPHTHTLSQAHLYMYFSYWLWMGGPAGLLRDSGGSRKYGSQGACCRWAY